jgi:predicted amidohydrolase
VKNQKILFLLCFILLLITACDWDENNILPPFSQTWKAPMKYDDNGATRTINVAAVSFEVNISPEVNRNKIVTFIEKIKTEQPEIRLILFPETILGYYYRSSNPSEYQNSIAETIPGITTDIISLKAIEHQIYVSFGMVEKSGEDIYNSQVLIDPNGNIISVYHKRYFTGWDKENGFKVGNNFTVDVIDNIKVATIICYDIHNLEINRKIHNSGAELVLHPVANTANTTNILFPKYKFTYTWHLSANRVGKEDDINYDGMLYLTSPGGEIIKMSIDKEYYIYGIVKCR